MKFAILGSRGYPSYYGGYETLVRILAPALAGRGHEVTVYCRDQPGSTANWIVGPVRCRATRGIDSKSLSTLTFGLTSVLDSTVRGFDAALVLNVANGFFLPALRAAGVPCAVNTDGIEWERGKWSTAGKKVFLAGAHATARFATALIADSEAIGDIWFDRFGVRSTFIPYGAPVLDSTGARRLASLGLRPRKYALAVARLIPENNVDLLLDAAAEGHLDFPIVVVGSAVGTAPIEERLARLTESGLVKWLGHVNDQELLNELWANAGVYVHGHSVGGTNPGLLQAMGAGAPTLALDTVFNREVIRSDDQMFGKDPIALRAKMRSVMDNPLRQAELACRGQEVVRSRYSWDGVSDRYESLLTSIAR